MFICTNSHEIMTLESHKFPIFVDISMACQAWLFEYTPTAPISSMPPSFLQNAILAVQHEHEQHLLSQHSIGEKKNNIQNIWNNKIKCKKNFQFTLTSTALSRTTWETVSRNWAAMPGLLRPRVKRRSAIPCNLSLIKQTKKIITKNATMPNKTIHSVCVFAVMS